MQNQYRPAPLSNVHGGVLFCAQVSIGSAGALGAGSEKGSFFTVSKTDTGEYTFVFSDVTRNAFFLDAAVTGTDRASAQIASVTVGSDSTTVVVKTFAGGSTSAADLSTRTLTLIGVMEMSAAGERV